MPFGFLFAFVNFDYITQTLKYVERKSQRQSYVQKNQRIIPVDELSDSRHVFVEKIEIFEKKQGAEVGDDAHYQKNFSFASDGFGYLNAQNIIDAY